MENQALQKAFFEACLSYQVLSIRDEKGTMTPLIHRTKIRDHIPKICAAIGIEIDSHDVERLITPQGVLDEQSISNITKTNRSILTVAMVIVTIRYHRSNTLPQFATVDWIRRHFKQIELQKYHGSGKTHWVFVDWYALVKTNIFIRVPLPSEQNVS